MGWQAEAESALRFLNSFMGKSKYFW